MVCTRALLFVALAGCAWAEDTGCFGQDICSGHATYTDEAAMLQHKNSIGLKMEVRQQTDVARRGESGQGSDASLVMLPESEYGAIGGRCLNGSMAGYYYGAPSSGQSSTWVIWMDGGGACFDEASCGVWNDDLGDSQSWALTRKGASRIVSDDAAVNPHFHDAHHVQVPYCTGDVHSGMNMEPTTIGETPFYFSGHLNFKNILHHIGRNYRSEARQMERILLTGSSAGGVGVINNCDFLQTSLVEAGSSAQVSCAPGAGWFSPGFTEDHPEDQTASPSLYDDWRASPPVATPFLEHDLWQAHRPIECAAALEASGEAWKCASATVAYPYIQSPMYVQQNWFDFNQIGKLGLERNELESAQGQDFVGYFGRAMRNSVNLVAEHPFGKEGDGLFLASCMDHSDGIGGIGVTETLVKTYNSSESLADWFYGFGQIPAVLIDDCQQSGPGLPCNPTCWTVTEA